VGEGKVVCPLRRAALALPGAPAILGPDGAVDYAGLDGRVTAACERLEELGIGAGARVGLYLPKDERYVTLLLALIRAVAVAAPLSTRLPPEAVPPLLRRSGCGLIVSDDAKVLDVCDDVRRLRPGEPPGAGEPAEREPAPELALDRPVTLISTSGSTGAPKAALHTLGNHYWSALGSGANIPLAPGDRWLHTLPLYHVGGLSIVFRCLLAGAAVALPEPGVPLGESIVRAGATHVSLVATQLRRLLREEAAETGSLKAVLLGGGPVPVSLVEEAASRGVPIHTSYGLTEMASQVTTTPPDAPMEALRTSGRVLPHREVRISPEREILVRGRTLFAGYVEDGETVLPLDPEGWFHTGDLGEMSSDGYLSVLGRRDNLFVSGGENVQPEEIEEALRRVEGVEEAVVVPVPDEEFGERPVAFVKKRAGVEDEDLSKALEPVLPRFKVPTAFHAWPASADLERMKIDRAFFRAEALRVRGGKNGYSTDQNH